MDYAFIDPDKDEAYDHLRRALRNRANTSLESGTRTVMEFLKLLDARADVNKPVGDLLVGSHANDDGWIRARFADQQKDETTYVEVMRVFDTARSAFLIPSRLYQGAAQPISLRIVGCQAGKSPEMLRILKMVMGGTVPIVGCKWFYQFTSTEGHGAFSWFMYSFNAYSPKKLKKHEDVIALIKARAATHAADYQFIDGTPVPDPYWANWAPTDATLNQKTNKYGERLIDLQLPAAFKVRGINVFVESRHVPRDFARTIPNMPKPAKANEHATLKQKLATLPEFHDTHEYPTYRRKGCKSVDEFVDSFSWQLEKSGTACKCTGIRHDYTLLVPVKRPDPAKHWKDQDLLYNFYPDPGTGLPQIQNIADDDPRFFVRV